MIRNEWIAALAESLQTFEETAASEDEKEVVYLLALTLHDNLEWENSTDLAEEGAGHDKADIIQQRYGSSNIGRA